MADLLPAPVLVDRFLGHLAVERGASPNTVRAYAADLARYLEWAERSGVDPITLTHRQMRLYLAELDRAGYARRTVARRLSAVRSLFAYLVAEGLAPSDPSSVLAAPKIPATVAQDRAPGGAFGDAGVAGCRDPHRYERPCGSRAALRNRRTSERDRRAPSRRPGPRSGSDHGDGEGVERAHHPAAPKSCRFGQVVSRRRQTHSWSRRPATTTYSSRRGAVRSHLTRFAASSSRRPKRRVQHTHFRRTRCVTRSRLTSSKRAPTCVRCRNSWATLPCPPPKSILTLV